MKKGLDLISEIFIKDKDQLIENSAIIDKLDNVGKKEKTTEGKNKDLDKKSVYKKNWTGLKIWDCCSSILLR